MAKKDESQPATKQAHWLNKKQMATSCGISTQAFDKWGVQPITKIGREAFFLVEDVVENRLARFIPDDDESDNLEGANYDREKTRLTKEQADAQALKNKIARRESAPILLITTAISRASAQAGAILGSVKLNVKRALPHLKAAELEVIEREIVKAQNAICSAEVDFSDLDSS